MQITKKYIFIVAFVLLAVSALIFMVLDWKVGDFEFFKPQNYQFYFQSWVSIAGILFTFTMSITTFVIYKKSEIASLKFISFSFLLTSAAYLITGYHASYCKVCSDLSLCSASHNYSNYFLVIAVVITAITVLLVNLKNNIVSLKLFSLGVISGSLLLLIVLIISIEFMETPDIISYAAINANSQGFVFIFPMLLILFTFIYFKSVYEISKVISFVFLLMFVSFIPQAYHVFVCTDCHSLECSEFYVFSGLLMFMAIGLLIYAISLQMQAKK